MSNSKFINAYKWFDSNKWTVYHFQQLAWNAYTQGKHGIVNAPTGSGKTLSLLIPILLNSKKNKPNQLKAIWISPIKALTKEIKNAAEKTIAALGLDFTVEIRSGDTSTTNRKKQISNPPNLLITTPESIHVLFTSKNYAKYFENLEAVVVDEWHELVGSKRGVQVELALSRFKSIASNLKIWGISATIGNLEEAMEVLLSNKSKNSIIIKSSIEKSIIVETLKPDQIDKFPWAGHLGLTMVEKLIPIINASKSTLIFVNTRAQCEIWYQRILATEPMLAGNIAMHHGSMDRNLRDWVEEALHSEKIKAVVCTSSLDLGVDFRPVDTIVQIGSPKGVARFVQRAGRSGHQPGALSKIIFVPTHALELIEAAALRTAIKDNIVETRIPYIRSFDVLIQYLVSLSVSDGFVEEEIFKEVKDTFSFNSIQRSDWQWIMSFLVHGGKSLSAYDEFKKIHLVGDRYFINSPYLARKHKMSIGTISSSTMIQLKFLRGKNIGSVEEYFISSLNPGDVFWFAGRNLEFIMLKSMTAIVRPSKTKASKVPSYLGGRLPLSLNLSHALRKEYTKYHQPIENQQEELVFLKPLFDLQNHRSHVPTENDFLIEYFYDNEGYHLLMYPFEGRNVHEGLAALLANRISKSMPISFTIAMNDYGFELLSDTKIDFRKIITKDLFSSKQLELDIQGSINAVEMARRKFRDIAKISGLVFQGFPGKFKKERHLQSSAQLIYDVFREYEPDNLLFLQTIDEVMTFQFEEARMREALTRIQQQNFLYSEFSKASPFSFPIIVDRLRESLSSEKLSDRIAKYTLNAE